jgi:nucleoside permease NupC
VGVTAMLGYSEAGSKFVFGDKLGKSVSGSVRDHLRVPGAAHHHLHRVVFSILYYLGIMQWIVKGFAIVMQR